MADIPDIPPLNPGWPVRQVDKSGDKHKEKDQKQGKKKIDKKKRGDDDTSIFDDFA